MLIKGREQSQQVLIFPFLKRPDEPSCHAAKGESRLYHGSFKGLQIDRLVVAPVEADDALVDLDLVRIGGDKGGIRPSALRR